MVKKHYAPVILALGLRRSSTTHNTPGPALRATRSVDDLASAGGHEGKHAVGSHRSDRRAGFGRLEPRQMAAHGEVHAVDGCQLVGHVRRARPRVEHHARGEGPELLQDREQPPIGLHAVHLGRHYSLQSS